MESIDRRQRLSATAGYYAAMISLGLGSAVIGPTLAGLAQQTHAPISAMGIVFSALSLGYLVGSLQSGHWFDRLPGHRVLAIALVLVAALLALIPATATLWALAATLLVLGAAKAALDVGTNTLLLWLYRARIGGVINGLHFCFGIGALVAPAIVAWSLRGSGDAALAYWTIAALITPVALWFFWLPDAPAPVRASTHQPVPTDRRLVGLIATVFALYAAAEVGYGGWVSTYAATLGFGDAAEAAYLTSVFWGTLTLGRLVAIPLASRFPPAAIIGVDLLGALLCVAAILLAPDSARTLWIATAILGFCLASIFPTLLVFSGERMAVSGRSTSWYMAGASVGSMTLPWIIGQLFAAVGPATMMWLVGAALLLGASVFLLAVRHSIDPVHR
jgi:MFS transporter, FHS family, Na+ dependent glucose transporter 1